MKLRATSLALAGLMTAALAAPAAASFAGGPASGIYLNGRPAHMLEYQLYQGVNYITVESFLTMMDEEAVVEQEGGTVMVNATTVTGVVDVEDSDEGSAQQRPNDGADQPGAGQPGQTADFGEASASLQQREEGSDPSVAALQANVVEETLTLAATQGSKYVVANGRYLYVKDGVLSIGGAVALPIRVLAEIFNLSVGYDGTTGDVTLTSIADADAYLESGEQYYNSDSLYWLSRIIHAESGNQPLEGKIAVGNVVLNRVASPLFPDTVYDVIFQRNQFTPTINGSIYRTPSAAAVEAAKLVLDGAVVLDNALFFNVAGMNSYAAQNRPYVATIGNHAFYA